MVKNAFITGYLSSGGSLLKNESSLIVRTKTLSGESREV